MLDLFASTIHFKQSSDVCNCKSCLILFPFPGPFHGDPIPSFFHVQPCTPGDSATRMAAVGALRSRNSRLHDTWIFPPTQHEGLGWDSRGEKCDNSGGDWVGVVNPTWNFNKVQCLGLSEHVVANHWGYIYSHCSSSNFVSRLYIEQCLVILVRNLPRRTIYMFLFSEIWDKLKNDLWQRNDKNLSPSPFLEFTKKTCKICHKNYVTKICEQIHCKEPRLDWLFSTTTAKHPNLWLLRPRCWEKFTSS